MKPETLAALAECQKRCEKEKADREAESDRLQAVEDAKPILTPEELAAAMEKICVGNDIEAEHQDADALMVMTLRKLGYGAAMDIFDSAKQWYA